MRRIPIREASATRTARQSLGQRHISVAINRVLTMRCPGSRCDTPGSDRLGKVRKAKAVKAVADFLFRYMVARYRCVGGALPSSRIQLTAEGKRGAHLHGGDVVVANRA